MLDIRYRNIDLSLGAFSFKTVPLQTTEDKQAPSAAWVVQLKFPTAFPPRARTFSRSEAMTAFSPGSSWNRPVLQAAVVIGPNTLAPTGVCAVSKVGTVGANNS